MERWGINTHKPVHVEVTEKVINHTNLENISIRNKHFVNAKPGFNIRS